MLRNQDGAVGVKLKYGPIKGNTELYISGYMGASEVIANQSGRFVNQDGSGYLDIADASDEITGWVEGAAQTCSATDGNTVVSLIPAAACIGIIFRIPVNSGTYDITMRGKTCDLDITSNVQGAALGASTYDQVIIVGGDLTNNNWVDVMLNPYDIGQTGVI